MDIFSNFKKLTNYFIFVEILVCLTFILPFNAWAQFSILMVGFIFSLVYSFLGIKYYIKRRKE